MNVMIIGGAGYIGSRLMRQLQEKHTVRSIDLCWFGNVDKHSQKMDYNSLSDDTFDHYDAVILLAGHSSVKMCIDDYYSSFNNNVRNFISITDKINRCKYPPKFIYASSSSVYGFTGGRVVDETYEHYQTTNNYDLSKYIIDLYMLNGKRNGLPIIPEWYGLRFGTVNGWSPNFRRELMINSMTTDAITKNEIEVSNSFINRAILGITDLCNSIELILLNGSAKKSGIYNLSSFNDNVHNIANFVSAGTGARIVDHGTVGVAYDFMISNKKFTDVFGYKFRDNTYSIVKEIMNNELNSTNRNTGVLYD